VHYLSIVLSVTGYPKHDLYLALFPVGDEAPDLLERSSVLLLIFAAGVLWVQEGISQNHRMVGVGRDLCGSSSPTPLPRQGHLGQVAQDLVQAVFEYLQRRGVHNLCGQPVPVLHHPQSEEVLPHVQMELPMLQFVPVAPCLVAGDY